MKKYEPEKIVLHRIVPYQNNKTRMVRTNFWILVAMFPILVLRCIPVNPSWKFYVFFVMYPTGWINVQLSPALNLERPSLEMFLCMKENHKSRNFPKTKKCFYCKGLHNSAIRNKWQKVENPNPITTNVHHAQTNVSVLLQTAEITLGEVKIKALFEKNVYVKPS